LGNTLIVDASVTIVPRFVLRFFGSAGGTLQAFALRWSLWKVVEYTEVNNLPGFQADEDNITAHWPLIDPLVRANRRWRAWNKTLDNTTGVHVICASMNPNVTAYPNFAVEICATFCTKSRNITRPAPGAGCGKPDRSCKTGGTHWSMRINGFPWSTGTAGIALKVAFDTRRAIREIKRDGSSLLDETTPDPQESLSTNVTDDENDSVNDLGDQSTAAWERTVDISGGTCGVCAVAKVVREIYKEGEWSRDIDNFGNSVTDQELTLSRTVRVSYLSMIPEGTPQCQPSLLVWDPDYWSAQASGAFGLLPGFALIGALMVLWQ
jgi:hypothetical protein